MSATNARGTITELTPFRSPDPLPAANPELLVALQLLEVVAQDVCVLLCRADADGNAGEGVVSDVEANQLSDLPRGATPETIGSAASSAQNASYAGSLCARMTSHGISISPAGVGTTR